MNQIKKLEIVGFKSFCDRTNISFHEGVTAIVGPNGCGKSNISEAISWVVGAQSAKALRADKKMTEVIFHGTEKRKATNFAEVLLTLSMDAVMEVPGFPDLNPGNFTVGRRLYRSGESEYSLDGRSCRMRDLQTLFEGTGLGPNSYAIIAQGRIGQILSDKPSDRRGLIEEAARITTFRRRKFEAKRDLEKAQQNILHVSAMEQIVEKEMNRLRRDAEKTRKYTRLRDDLRAVQKLKVGLEDRALREKLSECSERFRAAEERERGILQALTAAEGERDEARNACGVQGEVVSQLRDRLSALQMEAQAAAGAKENQEVQRQGQITRAQTLEREQASIADRSQEIAREIERLTKDLADKDGQIARERQAVEAAQAEDARQREVIHETDGKIEEIRSFQAQGVEDLAGSKNQQARSQENLRRIDERTERLRREQEAHAEEAHARRTELDAARREQEAQTARRGEMAAGIANLEAETRRRAARIEEVAAELTAAEAEHGQMRHRFDSLEEIERRRSNYSEGVQKYLSAKLPGEDAFQARTLADHVDADPAYESALEDYLNSPLQYILVDSREDAVSGVERLRRVGAGKCTFMTMRNGHGAHAPAAARPQLDGDGVIGYIDELLRMNADVKQAFDRVLPEYAATVMVHDLDTAFRLAERNGGGGSYLTLSGESYSPRGTLSAVGEKKSMAGFLALKREKRELEKKLSLLKAKIDAGHAELAQLKRRQGEETEGLKNLLAEAQKLDIAIELAKVKVEQMVRDLDRLDQAARDAGAEIEKLAEERVGYEAQMAAAAGRIAELETRRGASDEELRELGARLQSLRTENAALGRDLNTLAAAYATSQANKANIEANLGRLRGEAEDARSRAEKNREEQVAAAGLIRELEASQEEIQGRITESERKIVEAKDDLEANQRRLGELNQALNDAEAKVRQAHDGREGAFTDRSKIETEKTLIESDLKHLEQNCLDEFKVPVIELLPDISDEDWGRSYEDVTGEYERLRHRIENFGGINQNAVEEFQVQEQEYQRLNGQRLDIEGSIKNIEKLIAELDQRSAEKFQEAYAAIRRNFQEVFQRLFGGGRCDLRLLDENDMLESGIEIMAEPPGKKMNNVQLMSGGERTLTALALLIAIFRYRSSPLCILDEVDAPLDETNVGRFSQVLSELCQDTQFIIITHNKTTMEAADTAFGVTMEEPGVSKIIGVDFRRYEERLAS